MTRLSLANSFDLAVIAEGRMQPADLRAVELDAKVDLSVTLLALPIDVCERLGLRPIRKDREGIVMSGLRISILGRDMTCDALAAPAGTVPLIGRIPLLGLDLVLDPEPGELQTNPAHPDGPVMYA